MSYGVICCVNGVLLRLMGSSSGCGCYVVLKQQGEKLSTYKTDWKGCNYIFVHKEIFKGKVKTYVSRAKDKFHLITLHESREREWMYGFILSLIPALDGMGD